jgi:hypothetical protein
MVPNTYHLTKSDGPLEEISADSYQREGEDWVFSLLSGEEVARIRMDDTVRISRSLGTSTANSHAVAEAGGQATMTKMPAYVRASLPSVPMRCASFATCSPGLDPQGKPCCTRSSVDMAPNPSHNWSRSPTPTGWRSCGC